jgi:hypothetical protein
MPTYVYATVMPDGSDGEMFEVFQKMSEAPLTVHPESGAPVRRVIVTPNVQTTTDKTRFSKSNLERLGFTKYERKGSGYFEKSAGDGPNAISADD